MKPPVCAACLDAEKLCPACEGRLAKGEVQHSDVELAKALHKLSFEHSQIEKTEVIRTHGAGDLMVIIVPKGTAGHIIGKRGLIIKELSDKMQKRIKVIEETADVKEFIQRVLHPAELRGLSVGVEGKRQIYKIKMRGTEKERVGDTNPLEKIFGEMLRGKAEIVFE